jgi:hypothetical protein
LGFEKRGGDDSPPLSYLKRTTVHPAGVYFFEYSSFILYLRTLPEGLRGRAARK